MSLAQPQQTPISIGLPPQQAMGARMVGPITLAWTLTTAVNTQSSATINDDLILENAEGMIDNIQSLYFDNSTNPGPVILTLGGLQVIELPARSQGYLPVFLSNAVRYSAVTFSPGVGTFNCFLYFFNTPCTPFIWSPPIPDSMMVRRLVQEVVNAGNTAIALTSNGGTPPLGTGKVAYLHGIAVYGTGATAEAFVTGTVVGISSSVNSQATQTYSFGIDVPILGSGSVRVEKTFDPPFRFVSLPTAGGYTFGNVSLNVPAMGAGQIGASAEIHWSYQ